MYSKCPRLYWERYEATDFLGFQKTPGPGGGLETEVPSNDKPTAGGPRASDPGGAGALQILGQPISSPGIELDRASEGRDFGSRFHQLLHERRLNSLGLRRIEASSGAVAVSGEYVAAPEWPDESIEVECQSLLASYEAHYVRDYEYLESERTSTIVLVRDCPICGGPGCVREDLPADQRACQTCGRVFTLHQLIVKLDAVVRHGDGTIGPFDTKTESRQGYNSREDWAGKTQAKVYLYALAHLYPHERVSRLVVDVVSRSSAKALRPAIFYRHDDIASSPADIQDCIRNINWVADDIEHSRKTGWWRSNTNLCKKGWEKCDYFDLHVLGRTAQNLKKYRPAAQYLEL